MKFFRLTWNLIFRPTIVCSMIPVNGKEIDQLKIDYWLIKDFIQYYTYKRVNSIADHLWSIR